MCLMHKENNVNEREMSTAICFVIKRIFFSLDYQKKINMSWKKEYEDVNISGEKYLKLNQQEMSYKWKIVWLKGKGLIEMVTKEAKCR